MKKEVNMPIKENLKSKGNVSITTIRGDRRLKTVTKQNYATQDLCKYIRDALLGDYVIARRPGIIIPCEKDINFEDGLRNMFSAGIPDEETTESVEEDENSASGVLKFIIPDTSLTVGHDIGGFRLYSKGTDRKLYAVVKLDQDITVTGDTSIEVKWTMKISPSEN